MCLSNFKRVAGVMTLTSPESRLHCIFIALNVHGNVHVHAREQLVKFYITFICPGPEYAIPVWHPGITQTLSSNIERVQRSSLRIIHPELSYERALAESDLPTLHARREHLCLSFARSLYNSPAFKHWFPPQRQNMHNYRLRNRSSITIPRCRSQRTLNAPIF